MIRKSYRGFQKLLYFYKVIDPCHDTLFYCAVEIILDFYQPKAPRCSASTTLPVSQGSGIHMNTHRSHDNLPCLRWRQIMTVMSLVILQEINVGKFPVVHNRSGYQVKSIKFWENVEKSMRSVVIYSILEQSIGQYNIPCVPNNEIAYYSSSINCIILLLVTAI